MKYAFSPATVATKPGPKACDVPEGKRGGEEGGRKREEEREEREREEKSREEQRRRHT